MAGSPVAHLPAARYTLQASEVKAVICHRKDTSNPSKEQFLVRWKGDPVSAPLSWHSLSELSDCLHLVQLYIEQFKILRRESLLLAPLNGSLKRKRLSEEESSLPTPVSYSSRSSSVASGSHVSAIAQKTSPGPGPVYNGTLRKKEGFIVARPGLLTVDGGMLPTPAMRAEALDTNTTSADSAIQYRYLQTLARLDPPVSFVNRQDRETPSLAFRFISEYTLRQGIARLPDDLVLGCEKCKPNMGQNKGCEYTRKCGCLEDAAVDESRMDDAQRADYRQRAADGNTSTNGLPKCFPYFSSGHRAGCLVDFYLQERHPIFECNHKCKCGKHCKNRNVQHGRKVRLQIFKTVDRGFGLRCLDNLQTGEFIDTYLGEIIDDAEATRREEEAEEPGKNSYLFSLDKFAGGGSGIRTEDCHVVDGQFMGTPTRFINHCCEPNVQMHTVSYNKNDHFIYDLAFFAGKDIAAGTELTFDYMDADDDKEAEATPQKTGVACRCGAKKCRGTLWT